MDLIEQDFRVSKTTRHQSIKLEDSQAMGKLATLIWNNNFTKEELR